MILSASLVVTKVVVKLVILLLLKFHQLCWCGTSVMSCALNVRESEFLFEQYSVPATLEPLRGRISKTFQL